jgi:uncharacterized protein
MSRLAFPFRPSADGRSAAVALGGPDHVRQMLEQLILTIPGERVMRPDFGSPAQQLLFGAGNGAAALALQATLAASISQTLGRWLTLIDLAASFDEASAILAITVDYRLTADGGAGRLTLERKL